MESRTWTTAALGAGAGMAGSVVQAAIGKGEEELLLPPGENMDLAPRLIQQVTDRVGISLSESGKWALGTLFHMGYGAAWGAAYALAREARPVRPVLGGMLLGATIYAITFPRWGGAVLTGTEPTPERRSRRWSFADLSVTMSFGLTTAWVYQRLRAT